MVEWLLPLFTVRVANSSHKPRPLPKGSPLPLIGRIPQLGMRTPEIGQKYGPIEGGVSNQYRRWCVHEARASHIPETGKYGHPVITRLGEALFNNTADGELTNGRHYTVSRNLH